MPIEFQCPHCGKKLKAKDQAAGRRLDCPGCGEPLAVPDIEVQYNTTTAEEQEVPSAEDNGEEETKRCPACGEKILTIAKKCKHCGEFLEDQEEQTPSESAHRRARTVRLVLGGIVGAVAAVALAGFALPDRAPRIRAKPSSPERRFGCSLLFFSGLDGKRGRVDDCTWGVQKPGDLA